MTQHTYTVWVYKSTATALSSGNVDFSLQTQLQSPPIVRGPIIRPLEGRAETQSWTVDVVDVTNSFSSKLANSSGRLVLMNRILAVRRAVDSSTATFLGVGRIGSVTLNEDVGSYRIGVEDEHRLARQTEIFTTNTTRLYPAGPHAKYGPFVPPPTALIMAKTLINSPSSTVRRSVLELSQVEDGLPPGGGFVETVIADRLPPDEFGGANASTATGNYRYLKLRVFSTSSTGTFYDLPVIGWGTNAQFLEGTEFESPLAEALEKGDPIRVIVYSRSSEISTAAYITGFYRNLQRCFLHMFTAPPSEDRPLHIGGVAGLRIGTLLQNIYQGTYSSSGATLPRISTSALDTLNSERRIPLMRFRITEGRQPMAAWLEANIYAPNLTAPVVDSQGRIAPVHMLTPQSSGTIGLTLTAARLREPHPSWDQTGLDHVTVAQYIYTQESWAPSIPTPIISGRGALRTERVRVISGGGIFYPAVETAFPHGVPVQPAIGGDNIAVLSKTSEVTQRSTVYGRRVLSIPAVGWHTEWGTPLVTADNFFNVGLFNRAPGNVRGMGLQILSRFADGPVMGRLYTLATGEALNAGDWAAINLASYPDPENQTRGGTRYVQILGRTDTPYGPELDYLDGGANASPLGSPTITLATAASTSKHALSVTIGSVTPAKARLQLAQGSTLPASGSTKWSNVAIGGTSGAYTIKSLPSGTTFWARTWKVQDGRFDSAFVTSTKKATPAITTPSGLATTSVTGSAAGLRWTVGDADYGVALYLDTSTSATLASTNRLATLPPGSNRYQVRGLNTATTYLIGVRHVDQYGGRSGFDSTKFATSTSLPALSAIPTVKVV